MKKILAILLLVVFVFSMSGCASKTYEVLNITSQRYYIPYTFEDLLEDDNIVIVGKAKSSTPIILISENESEYYDKYVAYTLSEIEVEEVISGDLKKGDIISVCEYGDGEVSICDNTEDYGGNINKGDYLILMLSKSKGEINYVIQGEKTFKDETVSYPEVIAHRYSYIIEAASDVLTLKNYYTAHPLQGRIWLTEDKQIDQVRNKNLLARTDSSTEVIRTGETYDEFVARLKSVIADLSTAE